MSLRFSGPIPEISPRCVAAGQCALETRIAAGYHGSTPHSHLEAQPVALEDSEARPVKPPDAYPSAQQGLPMFSWDGPLREHEESETHEGHCTAAGRLGGTQVPKDPHTKENRAHIPQHVIFVGSRHSYRRKIFGDVPTQLFDFDPQGCRCGLAMPEYRTRWP